MPAHRRKSGAHDDMPGKGRVAGKGKYVGKGKYAGKGKSAGKGKGKKRKYQSYQSDSDDEASPAAARPATGGKFADSVVRPGGGQDKHKPAELFRKDLISAMKMPDSEPLLMEEYIQIADSWRQDWEKGVQVPVNPDASRQFKAEVKETEPSARSGSFKLGERYILTHEEADRFTNTTHEYRNVNDLADMACRYDLDDLDVAWLEKYNEERVDMGQDPIPEYMLEKIMEALETTCYENMQRIKKSTIGLGVEFDENSVCNVCQSPDSEDANEMVFCDGCDVCVHQACYGVQNIPEGKWYCRTCALGISPQCELCPKKGGAMKPTRSGQKWAHVSCALWIPEVSIGDAEKMEPVTKIKDIKPTRWNLICCLCKIKQGAPIQCHVKTCKTAFHVTCAFEHKLDMNTEVDEEDEDEESASVHLQAYCPKHTAASPKKEKKNMTEQEKADTRSQKLAELEERFFTAVTAAEIAKALSYDVNLASFVYEYWKLKRKSNFGNPLLAPKAEEEDMLVKQQEGSLLARQKMFVQLRQDLERVRNLCYMISRREKERRRFYKTREEVFKKQLQVILSMNLSTSDQAIVIDANHSDTIYDNPQLWRFDLYGGDEPATPKEEPALTSEESDSDSSSKSTPSPVMSRTESVFFPQRTQEELHPSNPWRMSKALQDKVHSKIFRTKRPKPYINGVADRTHKKLAIYFKPLPRTLHKPQVHNGVQLYGSCAHKIYQDVDNEVSICISEGLSDGKENISDSESDLDVVKDSFLFPRVSDQFPQRVTRSRLTESLAKIWHSVSSI